MLYNHCVQSLKAQQSAAEKVRARLSVSLKNISLFNVIKVIERIPSVQNSSELTQRCFKESYL